LKNKRPPYWNSTYGFDLDHFAAISVLFCIRLPNFVQIGPSTTEIWCHIDFQDGGRRPCCICFVVMADHPGSAFRRLNSVLKSLVRRINSSRDIAMYRFWHFGLKLPIHAPFWGDFGEYFQHTTSLIVVTPQRTVLGRKHVVWAIQRKNRCNCSTWALGRERNIGQQKSHKSVIFPLFGGSPHLTDSTQKLLGG